MGNVMNLLKTKKICIFAKKQLKNYISLMVQILFLMRIINH
nr:MAG TPA: hypothetical protein [Bacteriophage sp.]